jgi:hypothetical protein
MNPTKFMRHKSRLARFFHAVYFAGTTMSAFPLLLLDKEFRKNAGIGSMERRRLFSIELRKVRASLEGYEKFKKLACF